MRPLTHVRKRDGRRVSFDRSKIAEAIFRAAQSVGGEDRFLAEQLAGLVQARLDQLRSAGHLPEVPGIEDVQDAVEKVLVESGHARTAKAFILYRERRAQARAARAGATADVGVWPVVGGPLAGGEPADGAARRWSKGALAQALVEADGLEAAEAEAVARAVEERLLASGLPRVTPEQVLGLVHAELLARGRATRLSLGPGAAPSRAEVEALLAPGPADRRALDPATLCAAAGETLLGRHLLEHALVRPVAEAHRLGDVHLYDLGAPLHLAAIALDAPAAGTAWLAAQGVASADPRAGTAALEGLIWRHAPYAARVLALEAVNVFLAPFFERLGDEALDEQVRLFLGSAALAALPRRGGLLRLELGLCAGVPRRLAREPLPPPFPEGRTFGHLAEAALRVVRSFVRVAAGLRRQGRWVDVALTLLLPRAPGRDAAQRALVQQALLCAGEGGEPVLVLEDPRAPSRGSRWWRIREAEAPDPLRFDRGDVSAASAVALNLVAAGVRAGASQEDLLRRELDRLLGLALDAVQARHDLLVAGARDPGGSLYGLVEGQHPLVDLESAAHLVEVVGLDQAAALVLPDAAAPARAELRASLVAQAHRRLVHEGAARRLHLALAEGLSGEAARRFARADAERFPTVAAWWGTGEEPSYGPAPQALGVRREPLHPDRLRGAPLLFRVRHRLGSGSRPPLPELVRALEDAERDRAVLEYAVDPWPRRVLRPTKPPAAEEGS